MALENFFRNGGVGTGHRISKDARGLWQDYIFHQNGQGVVVLSTPTIDLCHKRGFLCGTSAWRRLSAFDSFGNRDPLYRMPVEPKYDSPWVIFHKFR